MTCTHKERTYDRGTAYCLNPDCGEKLDRRTLCAYGECRNMPGDYERTLFYGNILYKAKVCGEHQWT